MKKTIMTFVALVAAFPAAGLLAVSLLMSPAAFAACLSSTSLTVGPVPESLTATTQSGATVTLDRQQLMHASTIISVGAQTEGVGRPGVVVALMAALTESGLRMLANSSAYPESAEQPNDGEGFDHDSLGLFQMRPAAGWGTVAELMDANYQARAFYGGSTGPNYPSPRGLLDIPGWQSLDPGEAAQSVEVSAYPDRYQSYRPVAETVLAALTRRAATTAGGIPLDDVPESTRLVFPLPSGTWVITDGFGWRTDPFSGESRLHAGTDLAAAEDSPIFALADGVVSYAGLSGTYGGLIVIEHTIAGQRIASAYAHMWQNGIYVTVGDRIVAGQHIGDVGSSGKSTGPHLHFEIRSGGTNSPTVDAEAWLADHGVENLDASTTAALCSAGAVA